LEILNVSLAWTLACVCSCLELSGDEVQSSECFDPGYACSYGYFPCDLVSLLFWLGLVYCFPLQLWLVRMTFTFAFF